jgi:hypothetical protein
MKILINLYSYNNTLYSYLIKKKQVNLLKLTIATAIL